MGLTRELTRSSFCGEGQERPEPSSTARHRRPATFSFESGIGGQSCRSRYRIDLKEDQEQHGVQQASADVGVGGGVGTTEAVRDRPKQEAEEEPHYIRKPAGNSQNQTRGEECHEDSRAVPPESRVLGDDPCPV